MIMKIGIIGEGETEYDCLPTLISKYGHTIVGVYSLGGVGGKYPWVELFTIKIYPYVRAFALKHPAGRPDKVLVILDREEREECCGTLASTAQALLRKKMEEDKLTMTLSVVLANRQLECWLLADTTALDMSPLFKNSISGLLGENVDERNVLNIIKANLKSGVNWNKRRYSKKLAQHLDIKNPKVLGRSRSLRKLVKEISL